MFGASILAYCFASRLNTSHISLKNWRKIPWARWCIMLVFLDSWLFHVYAGLLIQGYGLDRNDVTCQMAIYLCIVIYCLSKFLIYSFLIERVYVVWPHAGTRLSSKAFCLCMLMMIGYAGVAVIMIIGRNTYFEGDDCVIGLKRFASIPLLSYDLFLNVALTSMFLWPLQQAHFRDARLRKIARGTLYASLVALTTSSINMAVLTIMHGVERGWICLASCGLDVTVNALVLYCITGYKPEENTNYLTGMDFSAQFSQIARGTVLTSPRHTNSLPTRDLRLPAPVQDKYKPHRAALGITSRRQDTGTDTPPPQRPSLVQQDSYYLLRDRGTDYPHAHIETMESVKYERRTEPESHSSDINLPRIYWWSKWRWPGSWKGRRAADRLAVRAVNQHPPIEVQITRVQQIGTPSPEPYSILEGNGSLSEGKQSMVADIGH